jgi:AMMECR1 domain-containing protein
VADPEELDPKRYGIIVRLGPRRGLLLPDLEGVSTVEAQISIAKDKAGIPPEESPELFRFSVRRYT